MIISLIKFAVIAAALIAGGMYIYNRGHNKETVNSFAACVKAGGHILQTYPEQCSLPNLTKTFPNPAQITH